MGAGKTSVGQVLSKRLGWKFYDLDRIIEDREQASVSEIFAKAGEAAFREIESAALMDLLRSSTSDASVIAVGGGTFVQARNREIMHQAGGTTVLLDAPLEELERRCHAMDDVRPLARDRERFRELFNQRREAYALTQGRIETAGKTIEEVAGEIEHMIARRSQKSEVTK
jgi:shikimate kinase